MFQEASLFAHLSVMDNLRYGMKRVKGAQRVSMEQAIELLGIGHLLDRKPDLLSGGERQRDTLLPVPSACGQSSLAPYG